MDKMIKGTETEKSLLKAFAGESQAKNRYTFFSEVAKKEGYEQIAGIFYETALQEEMHAKRFFSRLEGGMLEITAAYPAGVILDTASNLVEAAEGDIYLRSVSPGFRQGEPVFKKDHFSVKYKCPADYLYCKAYLGYTGKRKRGAYFYHQCGIRAYFRRNDESIS